MSDYRFEGWVAQDASAVEGKMVWREYEPKIWEETDIDIKVTHSAICGSDIHTLGNGWGDAKFPCVVGHEIVGFVIRVGLEAGAFQVGDCVGVGAQSDACLSRGRTCSPCNDAEENYCSQRVNTYDSTHRNGSTAQGGYALYHRCPSHFVIKIPQGVAPEHAAPMLCGGVTVYSPLKRHNVGPRTKVGIIGVGGLGHFAILFAKALGASKVVAISRNSDKRKDIMELGADELIVTREDEGWSQSNAGQLDILISTVASSKMPFNRYLDLLKVGGKFVQLGAPEEPVPINVFPIARGRKYLTGSFIGSPKEIDEMLSLAADKQIKPWVELRSMKNANQAVVEMALGLPRFRYVLVN